MFNNTIVNMTVKRIFDKTKER